MSQTQSQALQTLQDQQGQLLTMLAPILPLIQAIPLHVENTKNNVMDFVKSSQGVQTQEIKAFFTSGGIILNPKPADTRPPILSSHKAPIPSGSFLRKRKRAGVHHQVRLSVTPDTSLGSPKTPTTFSPLPRSRQHVPHRDLEATKSGTFEDNPKSLRNHADNFPASRVLLLSESGRNDQQTEAMVHPLPVSLCLSPRSQPTSPHPFPSSCSSSPLSLAIDGSGLSETTFQYPHSAPKEPTASVSRPDQSGLIEGSASICDQLRSISRLAQTSKQSKPMSLKSRRVLLNNSAASVDMRLKFCCS